MDKTPNLGLNRYTFADKADARKITEDNDKIDLEITSKASASELNTIRDDVVQNYWSKSNLLVEEGIFTPVLIGTTGSTKDYHTRYGHYSRVGNSCFFELTFEISSLGDINGDLRVGGLPFPMIKNRPYGAKLGLFSATALTQGTISAYCVNGYVRLVYQYPSGSRDLRLDDITSSFYVLALSGKYTIE